ncbi:hypothetical protein SDC9_168133 [bioreactor metagenome]|uniref:Uncharacterized protein n=1 Tax=bioreactor metagenome TaxID=1076179 RepID=A0A645G9K8_9ZZZZ
MESNPAETFPSSPPRIKKVAKIGPKIQAKPLNDCEKLMRLSADSLSPSLVVYGLAAVSSVAKPQPRINKPIRNNTYDALIEAGTIRKAPAEKSSKPIMIPLL